MDASGNVKQQASGRSRRFVSRRFSLRHGDCLILKRVIVAASFLGDQASQASNDSER